MATVTASPTATEEPEGDQVVVMRDIGWAGYSAVLRARGETSVPRLVFLDGDLYLMSPSSPHEFFKKRLGVFVTELTVGLKIPCIPMGSTTFRRKRGKGGGEADESFYLSNAERIRGKRHQKLHLRKDPPPDLAIEVVYSNDSEPAVEVWRRFGVPEVWIYESSEIQILVLQNDESYRRSDTSAAFPFLRAAEIQEWIDAPQQGTETDWTIDLRAWVAQTLVERYRRDQEGKA